MNKFAVGDRIQLNLYERPYVYEDDGAFGTVVDIEYKHDGTPSYGIRLDMPLKEPSTFYSRLNAEHTFFRSVDKWLTPAIEDADLDISALI